MALVTVNAEKSFENPDGISILDAAVQAHVLLDHSCKTGRCGVCKSKVTHGKTRLLHSEMGLSPEEIEAGWILSCARTAVTDVHLQAQVLNGLQLPPAKIWPCRIQAIHHLNSNVVQVFLRLPPTATFDYWPGQYIQVIGPGGLRRSYSVANARKANGLVELHIRAVEGGAMSTYWFEQAKPDDLLRLQGPFGTFVWREPAPKHVYFLATGTGIAPVKAMVEAQMHHEGTLPITVIWGGRDVEDFYGDVADSFKGCHFIPVLSRPSADWRGATGYVQNVLLSLQPDWAQTRVYACGSDAMIRGAKAICIQAGLPDFAFHCDAFVSSGEGA